MNWLAGIRASVLAALAVVSGSAGADEPLPTLVISGDNTVISKSCVVVIPPGAILADADSDGVLHVAADDITIVFAPGSVLRGSAETLAPERRSGVGIRVRDRRRVTIRNAHVHGFKVAVHASTASGLVVEDADLSDNFAERLRSTPEAEDASDWLWPHRNDDNEWMRSYGGALVVEDSSDVTIRRVKVRRTQNGILLDRVLDSRVYDNDCSFLSGWGLAMWRSSRNVVSRNAFDFCVRGYSHGVYNRGQDSAGILAFEQCSGNVFAENSAICGGDGFFGFAGRDALGEAWMEQQRARLRSSTGKTEVDSAIVIPESESSWRSGAGCNANVFVGNDFSFAAAHGIELTFSFDNLIIGNRIVGNAICGVWGGYSARTCISGNFLQSNGDAGYGHERGGINIEHGRDNRIVANTFVDNAVGVHLWARTASPLARLPWSVANSEPDAEGQTRSIPSARTVIAHNTFEGDDVALRVRNARSTTFVKNATRNVERPIDADEQSQILSPESVDQPEPPPAIVVLGDASPVGARATLTGDGRQGIIMGAYFPWDHASPLVRRARVDRTETRETYEVFGAGQEVRAEVITGAVQVRVINRAEGAPATVPAEVRVWSTTPGVHPYAVMIAGDSIAQRVLGVLVRAQWTARVFAWTVDPMVDLPGWRTEANGDSAVEITLPAIDLALGTKGPSALGLDPRLTAAGLGTTRYGIIATTRVPMPKGRWMIRTRSDDGVRVIADGRTIIERWDIHVPTTDQAELVLAEPKDVEITVEYFQNQGHAALSVDIEPATAP